MARLQEDADSWRGVRLVVLLSVADALVWLGRTCRAPVLSLTYVDCGENENSLELHDCFSTRRVVDRCCD